MAVAAYVAHHIPGRVRIRIPAAKGRPDLLREITTTVASAAGVKGVECNPLTGSILIQYAPEAYKDLKALGSAWRARGVTILAKMPSTASGHSRKVSRKGPKPSAAAQRISSFFEELDHQIRVGTDNELDLRVILPIMAVIVGLLAYSRPPMATPLWLTLIIFAFHSFLSLHSAAEVEELQELAATAGGEPEEFPLEPS